MWHLKTQYTEPFVWLTGVFNSDELDRIRNLHQSGQPGLVGVNQRVDGIRRSDVCWIESNEHSWIYQKLTDAIDWANQRYYNYDVEWMEKIQLASYDEEILGRYGQHVDHATTAAEGGIAGTRKLSVSVQLSAGTDYDGGDLKFYTAAQPSVAGREAGTVIVFPSFLLHEVTPVTRGQRQSLVTWVHGPRFR